MGVLVFLLVSIIEWTAMLILIFSMFRYRIVEKTAFIIFVAIFMSMFSYILRDVFHIGVIAPLIQIIALFVIFRFLLNIPYVYAGLLVSFGYISYVAIQILLFMIVIRMNLLPVENALDQYPEVYVVNLTTALISFLISRALVHYRIGFTSDPNTLLRQGIRGQLPFLGVSAFSAALLGVSIFSVEKMFVQIIFILMTVALGYLLYLIFHREIERK